MSEPYLVTGALGCIGAWVVHQLLERGDQPYVFDLPGDRRRILDLVGEDGLARVTFLDGDITDQATVTSALARSGAARIVHLAGLQVPFCRAAPAQGALVNVLGTIHVFEAAKARPGTRVVYASSAAVYGPPLGAADGKGAAGERPSESVAAEPITHYGVYKRANEGTARVYWLESGVSSVGLRPLTVYGVGRDQGMTSGPTTALKAAVVGAPFHIGFSGATDVLYTADCAAAFLAAVDRAPEGAHALNLSGESVEVARFVSELERHVPAEHAARITVGGPELPLPPALDGHAFDALVPGVARTPLAEGVRQTIERFAALHARGRLDTRDIPTLAGGANA
ncbi:MAG: SDR family oxidoreductase [Planctomycetota bacterium]